MQTDLFSYIFKQFKFDKDKPIKLFEAFSGVGMQRMALNRLGVNYESVGYSEIDKYAIKSYETIHDDDQNYGDICKIKGAELPQIDLFTYSFPCTDLSKAGQQKGLKNTRSGLVYEVLRILQELKQDNNLPKVLLMENVVDLVQSKFIKQFNEIQKELEKLGYSNYTQCLNAKNYGVAQNRDRVFMVSILGDYYYQFPQPIPLEKRLRDYLQPIEEIEEKYYLSDKALATFTDNTNRNGLVRSEKFNPQTREACEDTSDYIKEPLCLNSKVNGKQPSIAVKTDGVIIPEATKQGYAIAKDGDGIYINRPHQKRGVVQKGMIQTLKTSCNDVGIVLKSNNYVIRKLTPLECWRLMGIDDEDFYKAQEVNSNAQLYKQAGNGIVVDVLVAIFKQLC